MTKVILKITYQTAFCLGICCSQVLADEGSHHSLSESQSSALEVASSEADIKSVASCRQFLQVDSPQFLNSYWGKFFMSKGFQQALVLDYIQFYKFKFITSANVNRIEENIKLRVSALSSKSDIPSYISYSIDHSSAERFRHSLFEFGRDGKVFYHFLESFSVPDMTDQLPSDAQRKIKDMYGIIHNKMMLIDEKDQKEAMQYASDFNKLSHFEKDVLLSKFVQMSNELIPLILEQARVYHLELLMREDAAAKKLRKSDPQWWKITKATATGVASGAMLHLVGDIALIEAAMAGVVALPIKMFGLPALGQARRLFQMSRSKARIELQRKHLLIDDQSLKVSEADAWMRRLSGCLEDQVPQLGSGETQACSYRSKVDSYKSAGETELRIDASSSDDQILEFGTSLQMSFFEMSSEILPRLQFLKDPNRFAGLQVALQRILRDKNYISVGEVIQELSPLLKSAIKDLSQSKDLKEIRKDFEVIGQSLNEAIVLGTDVYTTATANLDKEDSSWDKWELLDTRIKGLIETSRHVQSGRVVLTANLKELEGLRHQLMQFLSVLSSMALEGQKKLTEVPVLNEQIQMLANGFEA